jgi:branched-chain amino acid transport system substrate-binding protein
MSRTRLVSFAVAMALGVLPVAAGAADSYEINVVIPTTGVFAFVGTTHQKELTALQDVVNRDGGIQGHPVHFVFFDDQSQPAVSLQLVNQILAKKPAVVLGSSLGALCKVTMPSFAAGPVDYCFSPVISPPPNGYVFSASVSGTDLIRASIRYFRGRGWKRFATLNTTDASGQIADADVASTLKLPENSDMQLVAAEHFNATDTGVTAQVAKIKAANPQAIIVWSPGTPFGTALHGIQDVGLDIPVLTSSANMIVKQMSSYAGFVPKDVYFQGVQYIAGLPPHVKDTRPLRVFSAAMKANGIPQDFQSGIAWDAAMIVIDALRKLGPNASASDLHDYLEKLHDYTGITGVYDFRDGNQRGVTVDDALIMRWDADKTDFVPVSKYGGLPL